jgi:mevalonate kinase
LVTFDLPELKNDVETGMYFDSSIPQGYGVGSSGALAANMTDMPKTKLLF